MISPEDLKAIEERQVARKSDPWSIEEFKGPSPWPIANLLDNSQPRAEAERRSADDIDALLAEVRSLQALGMVVAEMEELHGGGFNHQNCSAAEDCAIRAVLEIVRKKTRETT